ncbi:O-antigen ligase family protein [Methylobacterium sp. JK268]
MGTPGKPPDRTRAGSPRSGATTRIESVSLSLLCGAVAIAPLSYGAVEPAWTAALLAAVGASLLLARWPRDASALAAPARAILATIVLVAGIALIQHWPGAPLVAADPVWAEVGPLLGRALPERAAAVAALPRETLAPALLIALTAMRALLAGADRRATRRLLAVLAWSGLLYAVAGIVLLEVAPDRTLWGVKTAYLGSLTGPFVNRNTAATYFGSAAVLWLIAALRRRGPADARRRVGAACAFLCCLGAVALTGSRAGFLLSVGTAGACALLCRPGRSFRRGARRGRRAAAAAATLLALALAEFWGGAIAARIQSGGLGDEGRLQVYATVLRMMAERPLLGFGLGSFEAVFPAYRGAALGSYGVWDIAHSTPLELGVELGIPALAGVAALWCWGAVTLARAYRGGRRGVSAVAAALCVGGLGTLHSAVDFSLQIPGYAVAFAAVVGCGLGRACTILARTSPGRDLRTERRVLPAMPDRVNRAEAERLA